MRSSKIHAILLSLMVTVMLFIFAFPATAAPKKDTSSHKFKTKTTATPSPTPSPTVTPTPTPTPPPTSTPSPVPSPTASPSPTPSPTITPTPSPQGKTIIGFTTYYYTGDKSSYNSMVNNKSTIDEIITATHVTDGYGNITGLLPADQITYANSNNIKPLVLLGNNFNGDTAKTLLESSANRRNLINNLLNLIKANSYKGVNIDLEGVYSSDRSYYTTFMSEVYAALNPLGYTVSVSVPAKTSDNPYNTWSYPYDYASISKYADQVIIMAYDEHYPGGSPGAVASIEWVENVVKYAATVIPSQKIFVGMAAYGYDWSVNGTKAYSINGCYNLAASYNAAIQWDPTAQAPYFTYTDSSGVKHTVWFENAQSLGYKLDVVNANGVAGISIWRLGLENTDYWNMIKSKLSR